MFLSCVVHVLPFFSGAEQSCRKRGMMSILRVIKKIAVFLFSCAWASSGRSFRLVQAYNVRLPSTSSSFAAARVAMRYAFGGYGCRTIFGQTSCAKHCLLFFRGNFFEGEEFVVS